MIFLLLAEVCGRNFLDDSIGTINPNEAYLKKFSNEPFVLKIVYFPQVQILIVSSRI